ncbi:MAG: GNAT family N-acetyltransferase [Bacilli bacterium]|nr:GNAT family N-acetyltransferase [Bacilli bacterium]
MDFRIAEEKDIPRLLDLLLQIANLHAALRPDLFKKGERKYEEGELRSILKRPDRPIYVAVFEGNVVGYAFCEQTSSGTTRQKTLYIDDFCVDESMQNQGIGSALFAYVKAQAALNGVEAITLHLWAGNQEAASFYKKMGLEVRYLALECPIKGQG